jgi:hypothetical protein
MSETQNKEANAVAKRGEEGETSNVIPKQSSGFPMTLQQADALEHNLESMRKGLRW